MLSLTLLLMILLETPTVQGFLGERVAAILSSNLGTNVKVGKIHISLPSRITADDVVLYDQSGKEMLRTNRLSASIELTPLADGHISISSAQIFGASLNLYQPSSEQPTNFQFIIDALSSKDTTKRSSTNIHIGSLIIRRSRIKFDRLDKPQTQTFTPNHLNISDISGHLQLRTLTNDSLNIEIKKLSLCEQSGLVLNRLAMKLTSGRHSTYLSDFTLQLSKTVINTDGFLVNHRSTIEKGTASSSLFQIDPSSISVEGNINIPNLTPADFAFLTPSLSNENDRLSASIVLDSKDKKIHLNALDIKTNDNRLHVSMNGWISSWYDTPEWHINLKKFEVSNKTLNLTSLNMSDTTSIVPRIIRRIGHIEAYGYAHSNDGKSIHSDIKAISNVGNIKANIDLAADRTFSGNISTDELHVGHLLGEGNLGSATANIQLNGLLPQDGSPTINTTGIISALEYNGYRFANINLSARHSANETEGKLTMTDPHANFDVAGKFINNGKTSRLKAKFMVNDLCPSSIKLSDKWGDARFNGTVDIDFTAGNINNARGKLSVKNLNMISQDDSYSLKSLNIISGYDNLNKKFMLINGDFGTARLVGDFDYTTISQSFANAIKRKLPTIPGLPTNKKEPNNSFIFSAEIDRTDWLDKLLGIPFNIYEYTALYAKVDDKAKELMMTADIPLFTYNNTEYHNTFISISQPNDTLHCDIRTDKINNDGTRTIIQAKGNAADNKLSTSLEWGNTSNLNKFSGQVYTSSQFYADTKGRRTAQISIHPSLIIINNAKWGMQPSAITYSDGDITIDNFSISHNKQRIAINGTASSLPTDSVRINLQDVDTKYILDLIQFRSVKFSGRATGSAYIKTPFTDLTAAGKLMVNHFAFQDGGMGVLDANVKWNKTEKQIDIDAVADNGQHSMTYIKGYVSPVRSYIDLGIKAEGTSIEFLQSFTKSFAKDVSGNARGFARVVGPLKEINLLGDMVVNGEFFVKPLGCKYFLRNDSVHMTHNAFELRNIPIFDKNNNRGRVNGGIYHKNLSKISYDLNVSTDNLLVYDFKDFGENTFYGTILASGDVGIQGGSGVLNMDINVTPELGSSFTNNVSDQNSVANREFIQWNDISKRQTPTYLTEGRNTRLSTNRTNHHANDAKSNISARQTSSDLRLNFIINTTPNFTLRLLMNSATDDYITLNGNGVLKASYYNKGAFNMFGTYRVNHGTYEMTIQDILKKKFSFNDGGTIVFGGDPFQATLNMQATHTVNGVSLADLNVGDSYKNNTTRVNCIMNIGGQPLQPEITFDIDLPTASNDEKQMIRSILSSEDILNQQVVYLLGIGRFYPQNSNNAESQGENQQNQTQLAMQSLSSGILSGQISNMLNNVLNSNNWSFGANISTGNEGWNNAEYEGLLSGRLLNNRLLINGQFGYRDNVTTGNANFVGDFDVRYLLLPNGNLAIKIYNQTNDRYFTKSSLTTQGVGLVMKKDFTNIFDFFGIKKAKRRNTTEDNKKRQE